MVYVSNTYQFNIISLICSLVNSCVSVTEIDQGGLDDEIVNLVDLRKVKQLEIQSTDDTSRLYFLPKILM